LPLYWSIESLPTWLATPKAGREALLLAVLRRVTLLQMLLAPLLIAIPIGAIIAAAAFTDALDLRLAAVALVVVVALIAIELALVQVYFHLVERAFRHVIANHNGVPLPCPECEYDLRATRDLLCPECGTPLPDRYLDLRHELIDLEGGPSRGMPT